MVRSDTGKRGVRILIMAGAVLLAGPAWGQAAEDPGPSVRLAAQAPVYNADELAGLVGPIALYPDDLVAIVLPASTYPLQVVQAARFLTRLEDDPDLTPGLQWDASVVALLNYPPVVELLNQDLDWTRRLGEAVLAQESDVVEAIAQFREKALQAGNLRSDGRQRVSRKSGVITIVPADPTVVYVPYYEPHRVIHYSPVPVYRYYGYGYPSYYYPYPVGYSFGLGFFWGVTAAYIVGWNSRHLHVRYYGHPAHPYHGRVYNRRHYYRRPVARSHDRWPAYRAGGLRHGPRVHGQSRSAGPRTSQDRPGRVGRAQGRSASPRGRAVQAPATVDRRQRAGGRNGAGGRSAAGPAVSPGVRATPGTATRPSGNSVQRGARSQGRAAVAGGAGQNRVHRSARARPGATRPGATRPVPGAGAGTGRSVQSGLGRNFRSRSAAGAPVNAARARSAPPARSSPRSSAAPRSQARRQMQPSSRGRGWQSSGPSGARRGGGSFAGRQGRQR